MYWITKISQFECITIRKSAESFLKVIKKTYEQENGFVRVEMEIFSVLNSLKRLQNISIKDRFIGKNL